MNYEWPVHRCQETNLLTGKWETSIIRRTSFILYISCAYAAMVHGQAQISMHQQHYNPPHFFFLLHQLIPLNAKYLTCSSLPKGKIRSIAFDKTERHPKSDTICGQMVSTGIASYAMARALFVLNQIMQSRLQTKRNLTRGSRKSRKEANEQRGTAAQTF